MCNFHDNYYINKEVYGIFGNTCQKLVYVGERSRTFKEKAKEYESDVRFQKD
ncbi:hypothetical protein DPMN_106142 [Dreissena polymorpha]|uniref:Uncharacterized protein n=1 Tax=Dreissena polymorpha TaxID=45954 RepID=A0A9D4QIF4_DREPO|nr:hypothetical protein DPMN_106142 [Dreissena polymorpha]